jgi:nucleoside-diphosphate-sugar epimerase
MTAFVSDPDGELGRRLVELLEEEGIRTVTGDPDSGDDARRVVPDVDVVYLVADADGASGEPVSTMQEENLDRPLDLLELVDQGQRVVLLSSVQVYAPVPPARWPITEGFPRRAHGSWPTRVYGQQKIEAENAVARYADRRRFDYVLLRSTLRYGSGQGLPERIAADVRGRPRAALAAYEELGVMQWVAQEDVARALVLAGTSRVAAGEAFNVAGDEPCTVSDLVEALYGALGNGWGPQGLQDGAPMPERFDGSKASAMLGWSPTERLDEWLTDGGGVPWAGPRSTGAWAWGAGTDRSWHRSPVGRPAVRLGW